MVCMHDTGGIYNVSKVDIIYSPSRGWYGMQKEMHIV